MIPGLLRKTTGSGGLIGSGLLDGLTYDYYVSPTGGTGTGAIGDPWSLTYALAGGGGAITAGKHIAVRGGTYTVSGSWTMSSSINGAVGTGVDNLDSKVVFCAYQNELPVWRNSAAGTADVVKVNCNYVWVCGIEIYDNGWTNRNIGTTANGCITLGNPFGNGVKFIHCVIHDGEQCVQMSTGAVNSDKFEMYGCILYNAGVDQNPLGHNFYVHHTGSTTARFVIERNVVFASFGLLGQIYGNSDHVDWFDVLNNIWFNGGALSASNPYGSQMVLFGGGGQPPTNCRYLQNSLYGSDSNTRTLEIGFSAGNVNNFEAGNNYHVGGGSGVPSMDVNRPVVPQNTLNVHDNFWRVATSRSLFRISEADPPGYTWTNNEWRHVATSGFDGTSFSAWKTSSGLGASDTQFDADPTTTKVVVQSTNRYKSGRGFACFFNWASLANVPIDLSTILNVNDTYAVYDVRDLVTSVLTGTYSGGTVNFPTTQKPDPAPIGGFVGAADPTDTAPFFNAFLVVKT